jgi:hypothetical protein
LPTLTHSLSLFFFVLDATFEPHLKKIDEIDASLTELERTLNALDSYTLKMENKFRYLKNAKQSPYKKLPPTHTI